MVHTCLQCVPARGWLMGTPTGCEPAEWKTQCGQTVQTKRAGPQYQVMVVKALTEGFRSVVNVRYLLHVCFQPGRYVLGQCNGGMNLELLPGRHRSTVFGTDNNSVDVFVLSLHGPATVNAVVDRIRKVGLEAPDACDHIVISLTGRAQFQARWCAPRRIVRCHQWVPRELPLTCHACVSTK